MQENIKKRFETVTQNGSFTRVDKTCTADFYAGLDEEGRLAFKYRGNFIPKRDLKSADGIQLNQYRNTTFNTLQFTLCDHHNRDLFYVFCEDIIRSALDVINENEIYKTILCRFYSWKRMFSSQSKLLSENEIKGLIGELLFLKNYMFPWYGQSAAIRSWSGQELTHKDFSLNNIWYEVKTIHTTRNTVTISSIEQLESNNTGEMVVIMLERMSSGFDGININRLTTEIFDSIIENEDRDAFIRKITTQGFSSDENYDDLVYDLKLVNRYRVDQTFPALRRTDIPSAVSKSQYELLLPLLTEYLINE